MRPGSITHHSDFDQRYVKLNVMVDEPAAGLFQAPPSENHAPKGWYMIFLVTGQGMLSVAQWVLL